MCLPHHKGRLSDLKLKLSNDFLSNFSVERHFVELEGTNQSHHEEEKKEEEKLEDEEGKNRATNNADSAQICPGNAMPALDECMQLLPSLEQFAHMLLTCKKSRDGDRALRLHSLLCACGLEAHSSLGNYLVPLLVEVGSICYARHVFDRLLHLNYWAWNSLIAGYSKSGELERAFIVYHNMQHDESCHLNSFTVVALLKACAKAKDLERGSIFHARAVSMNFDSDLFVGSALVDMYAKCGILVKAHEVFDKLLDRDVVTWTALLTGYAEHGQSEDTLKFFEQMQLEGIFPDAITLVCNMKACGNVRAIYKGREMHTKAASLGLLERDAFLGSTLVDMYAKASLLALARQVFGRLPIHDVVAWTALITGYVENGLSQEALKCFEQMQSEGIPSDAITVVCSLKACVAAGAIQKGREIHAKIANAGLLDTDIAVANILIDMYAKCRLLTSAKQIFDELQRRDVISWTAMIAGNVEQGFCKEALKYLEQMQLEGVLPNTATFICSLKACSSMKAAEEGQAIHAEAEKRGLLNVDHLGTALIDMYVKCGLFATAEQVFNMLQVRDAVSWTSLISGYVEFGHDEEAFKCFEGMLCQGVSPTETTFLSILKACVSVIPLIEIHGEMERRALLDVNTVSGTTLVDMYAKCGSLTRAEEVFNKLRDRDVVSWNALITAYSDYGHFERALECYECMHQDAVAPDAVTFICILKVCGDVGEGQRVKEIHDEIKRRGFLDRDMEVGTTLIDTYAKLGSFVEVWKVFKNLPIRNVTSWNSLFAGYARYGRGAEAGFCLKQMELEGISPNLETLLHSLNVCGKIETNDTSNQIVSDMEILNRNPCADEYITYDLLSLSGQVFDKLPVQDLASWSALITGYLACGLYKETLECFERMQLSGFAPTADTWVCSLKACSSMESLEKGQEIHAEIERKGSLENDKVIGNTLINMYAKCGYLHIAHQVLEKLQLRDAISWTSLIHGHTEHQQWDDALDCIEQMQREGIVPDAVAYACSLKACGCVGAVVRGEALHAEVEREGLLKMGHLIGSALVDMYSHLGMLSRAHDVFSELPVRSIVAWTALMTGYLENGLFEEAIFCFEELQLDGVVPDNVTYVCVLKAYTEVGDLDKGMELHSHLEVMGCLEGDGILATTLIDMYAKYGLLGTAQFIFDRLTFRDEVLWTALIAGYSTYGDAENAISCLEQMELEGFSANSVTLMCTLRSCGRIGATHPGQDFHGEIIRKGLLQMDHVATALVDMYAKCGSFDSAMDLLDELPIRDRFSWTSLIGGLAECGYGEAALAALDQMLLEGGSLDAAVFVCSLKACSSTGSTDKGRELHAEIERVGLLQEDVVVGTSLIDMYVKGGMLLEAQEVFEKLPYHDVVCWTALIVGYTHYGHGEEALECYEQMQNEGLSPDAVSLVCILKACSSIGAIIKGQEIHLDVERRGFLGRDLAVGNTLINMYAKGGLLSLALQVFDKLPSHNTVSWNALISGYAQLGESQTMFENLKRMLGGGFKPDPATFKIIFGACGRTGLLQTSRICFDAMSNDYEFIPKLEHLVSMVDLLCHGGHLDKAIALIQKLPSSPNLVLWNRVLEACKQCGRLELGRQAFEYAIKGQMQVNGR